MAVENMRVGEVLKRLKARGDPESLEGMARFGIATEKAYGVRVPELRKLARDVGTDHELALQLWDTGVHEARILASMVDDPVLVGAEQMEAWARDFDSWDLCDQCCMNLFDRTPFAWRKAMEWSTREEEFVKRAAFALMASLAVHDKEAADEEFADLLPIIRRESVDERNFVKKAVNWALRQIGKRNLVLNTKAISTAEEILEIGSKSARWIASDALRELTGEKVRARLRG